MGEIPQKLQAKLDDALKAMRDHAEHHLHPRYRKVLYATIAECSSDEKRDNIVGWAAYHAAKRNIHLWDKIVALQIERYGMPDDEWRQDETDPLMMHHNMLKMCLELLNKTGDKKKISETISSMWYIVGNEADEIDEILGDKNIHPDSEEAKPFWQAYDALSAALRAVHHALGHHALDRGELKHDNKMPEFGLDTSGLAMRAECGNDKQKRLVYWEWWLKEAIPQAWDKVMDV